MITMKGRLAMALTVGGREIEGQLACPPVSTAGSTKDRWVVFELYHLDRGAWLSHRIGLSNIYHAADTWCTTRGGKQSGEPAGLHQLPDDAMPCPVCNPPFPQELPFEGQPVRFEYPRHTWDECPTPEVLKDKLCTIRSRDGSVSTFMSDPVSELLHSAAQTYPEFLPLLNEAA